MSYYGQSYGGYSGYGGYPSHGYSSTEHWPPSSSRDPRGYDRYQDRGRPLPRGRRCALLRCYPAAVASFSILRLCPCPPFLSPAPAPRFPCLLVTNLIFFYLFTRDSFSPPRFHRPPPHLDPPARPCRKLVCFGIPRAVSEAEFNSYFETRPGFVGIAHVRNSLFQFMFSPDVSPARQQSLPRVQRRAKRHCGHEGHARQKD